MPMPLTKAEVEAIARNPNVTAAIERLAEEYVTNRDMRTRTKSTIARERELLTDVDKAVWIAVENASRPVPTDIRPAVGGGGGAAGPGRVIGRDTTIVLTMDGRAKPPHVPSDVHRALERLVYDDPPGSDGDGKAWWGKALADGWTTDPICRDTEADAGVCEPHRGVCDNWSAAFPLSAPDGVCGGGR